jgi:hypothetical protein
MTCQDSFHIVYILYTLTSEVSRWQFFQDSAIEENNRLGWSNLPPCRAKNIVVNGSYTHRETTGLNDKFFIL